MSNQSRRKGDNAIIKSLDRPVPCCYDRVEMRAQQGNNARGGVVMSNLVRWDPFGDVRVLSRHMDRLFDDFFRGPRVLTWEPAELGFALDVYEKVDALVVKAALPGVRPDEVDISVTGDVLTVKGA